MNENAFYNLSYGVYIIATWDGDRPTGCIANSVMQITAYPAAFAISISHDNYTNQCIEKSGGFVISVLGEKAEPSMIGTFGFQTGKDVNKFDSVDYDVRGDMPIVKASCAYIICKVISKMETDTHTVFIGQAVDADNLIEDEVMTYAYYHKVIKGKSPKNAPTYRADAKAAEAEIKENVVKEDVVKEDVVKDAIIEAAKVEKYVCSICGYEYTGDVPFEELPADYTCPICRQPKTVFNKQS
ncbi:flavin reductase [[Clostridium] fimetarium]|uniref:NADH-FMN oxidoreductase RutF, flavin reductase (DIM6/NTAB) family n=1 Tax=[Clostridium] fimetarium TaxID=99656 RepID=A0A1I0Q7H5_9FIRM|nr:flavin reductase [[Clostridium] fimetarium]SEW22914.1 NADH-FMN oxidoreductase RutF, flavin reductase (DIM6/NTAB) family [[Clostridium] fimetarium]